MRKPSLKKAELSIEVLSADLWTASDSRAHFYLLIGSAGLKSMGLSEAMHSCKRIYTSICSNYQECKFHVSRGPRLDSNPSFPIS